MTIRWSKAKKSSKMMKNHLPAVQRSSKHLPLKAIGSEKNCLPSGSGRCVRGKKARNFSGFRGEFLGGSLTFFGIALESPLVWSTNLTNLIIQTTKIVLLQRFIVLWNVCKESMSTLHASYSYESSSQQRKEPNSPHICPTSNPLCRSKACHAAAAAIMAATCAGSMGAADTSNGGFFSKKQQHFHSLACRLWFW